MLKAFAGVDFKVTRWDDFKVNQGNFLSFADNDGIVIGASSAAEDAKNIVAVDFEVNRYFFEVNSGTSIIIEIL